MGVRGMVVLVGMMAVSLALAGCQNCGCFGNDKSSSEPVTQAFRPPNQVTSTAASPTRNMQMASTPPGNPGVTWSTQPDAPQVRTTDLAATRATPMQPTVNTPTEASRWNSTTPVAGTPVSSMRPTSEGTPTPVVRQPAAPTAEVQESTPPVTENYQGRRLSLPPAPTTERETFEVKAPTPTQPEQPGLQPRTFHMPEPVDPPAPRTGN